MARCAMVAAYADAGVPGARAGVGADGDAGSGGDVRKVARKRSRQSERVSCQSLWSDEAALGRIWCKEGDACVTPGR